MRWCRGGTVPAETGRPGYDPGDLLRLYLCGYLHRIRSSRRFEQETHRNVELMWLLRRRTPDLNTIADFRRDHPAAGHRRPFRHKARPPQVRAMTVAAPPPDLRRRPLVARASRSF